MTTDEFRDWLELHGISQGQLSRMFTMLGDQAAPKTIRRRVEQWAQGRSRIPGEITAFCTLLSRFPKVREQLIREEIEARRAAAEAEATVEADA